MKRTLTAVWMLAETLPLACASRPTEPKVASSARDTSYALDYPANAQWIVNDYINSESEVRRLTTGFARYPEQLKDPPWPVVTSVADQADQAGRGSAYVDARRELEATNRFFTQERDDISRRVNGSLQYAIKKNDKGDKPQCEVDFSGAVGPSLKDAVEKDQESRLRSHDEAHFTIERYRETLGRSNAATLEKQADEISSASYLVFIHSVEVEARADRMVDEASGVRDTLARSENDEKAFQAEAGRPAAEKRASNERVTKLEAAKGRIDAALPQLSSLAREIEQRNDALRKEYGDAFDALKKALASKSAAR